MLSGEDVGRGAEILNAFISFSKSRDYVAVEAEDEVCPGRCVLVIKGQSGGWICTGIRGLNECKCKVVADASNEAQGAHRCVSRSEVLCESTCCDESVEYRQNPVNPSKFHLEFGGV